MSNEAVENYDIVYRRIPSSWIVKDTKVPNGIRPSAEAFRDDKNGSSASVYLKSVLDELQLSAKDVADGKGSGWGVSATGVGLLVAENQQVLRDPIERSETPHVCDPAHALVEGDKTEKSRRDRIAAQLPIVYRVQ
jgi:hypothetical protein